MNLDDMLMEASIIDHTWMENGLSTVVEEQVKDMADPKPNNIKNELEVEWGNAGPQLDLGPDLDVVKRNLPEEAKGDTPGVILFARDMMNRGVMGEELVSALKDRFDSKTMAAEKEGLKAQLELQGFVGCVAIDGRGYKSCKEAIKVAENSPYKDSIKFVIGCSCGDSVDVPASGGDIVLAESSGNSMDDFIASDESYEPAMVSCCRTTMLPIVSAQTDIDESNMAPSTLDLMNVTGLPAGDMDKIEASDASWKDKTKMVFRAAYKSRKVAGKAPYSTKVDASEHKLTVADNEIELAGAAEGQIELESGMAEMTIESKGFEAQDIDMSQELSSVFEGSDEVPVDDAIKADASLDVDMRADMVI